MAKGYKTGGRNKGTPNKLTSEMRASLKTVISDEMEKLPSLLSELEPKVRIELVIRLLPYVFPKLENIDYNKGEPFEDFDVSKW